MTERRSYRMLETRIFSNLARSVVELYLSLADSPDQALRTATAWTVHEKN
jgi:hypothetical protein